MYINSIIMIILLVMSTSLMADDNPSVIRLSSTGEITVMPDTAQFDVAVETQAATAAQASADNAKKMQALTQTIQALLDKTGSFKTSSYQMNPVYQTNPDQQTNKIVGYRVSNQISVKTMNLTGLGDMLDNLVKAGGNQIQSLSFTYSDTKTIEQQAIAQAIQQAKVQAEFAAQAAGVKVVKLQEMDIPDSRPGPLFRTMAMGAMNGASTPMTPGELIISKQVNTVFVISP